MTAEYRRRWRVVIVIGSLDLGGSERQVVRLVRAMHPHTAECVVVCLGHEGRQAPTVREAGAKVIALRLKRIRPFGALRLARLIRRERPDVVYGFLFWGYTLALPLAALVRPRAARIAARRSLPDSDLPGRRWALQLRRIGDACTDAVIANSRAVAEAWAIEAPVLRGRFHVVGNGVEVPQQCAPVRSQPVTIVCVANLIAYKGHPVLLDAAARLPNDPARWTLVLVGDGPERSRLELLAEDRDLGDRVRFLGQRDDVAELLMRAQIAVLPSLTEGLPNAVLEAMAAGVPVVATCVGGTPDLLENGTGLLVEPGDPVALASALTALIADPELRARLGAAGRRVVKERFSVEAMRDGTLAAFTAAMAQRQRRDDA